VIVVDANVIAYLMLPGDLTARPRPCWPGTKSTLNPRQSSNGWLRASAQPMTASSSLWPDPGPLSRPPPASAPPGSDCPCMSTMTRPEIGVVLSQGRDPTRDAIGRTRSVVR
jgi:hypothetical protein